MEIEKCKGCNYLARPIYFNGGKKGIPQYKLEDNETYYLCCFGVDGGNRLSSITKCPKKGKRSNNHG